MTITKKNYKTKWQVTLSRMKKYWALYIMILPAIIGYSIFCYVPMYGITIAFKDFSFVKGIFWSPWVGFKHFQSLFDPILGKYFFRAFKNTLVISFLKLIVGFPAPIILAILFSELPFKRFKKFAQTVAYLPNFISWVIIAGIMTSLLSLDGPVNVVLGWFGINSIQFLTEVGWFVPVLIISEIWKSVGWNSIIYLAAITAIPEDLYEAAKVDGANRFQRIIHVTLPSMLPTVTMLLILNVGSLMNTNFDQIYNLYSPAVYSVGDVIETYVYRTGIMDGQFSFATAVGLFLNLINFSLLFFANWSSKKLNGTGIY
jgi:putative aldouronate transport system permease protein